MVTKGHREGQRAVIQTLTRGRKHNSNKARRGILAGRRFSVAAKFILVPAVLLPCLAATAWVGAHAQSRTEADANQLYSENVVGLQQTAQLEANVAAAGRAALEIIPVDRADRLAELRSNLYDHLVPDVDTAVAELLVTIDTPEEGAITKQLAVDWQQLKTLFNSPTFLATAVSTTIDAEANDRLAEQLAANWATMSSTLGRMRAYHDNQAHEAITRIGQDDQRSNQEMIVILIAAFVLGGGTLGWLIRDIVPRLRRYSKFAAGVAAGEPADPLRPKGRDELSRLGRVLDDLVDRRMAQRDDDRRQNEFSEALQVAGDEEEAHHLLKSHLERSLPGSTAVVLNRNNSANRLQAMTAPPDASPLRERLAGGPPPRACLAVRLGRPHEEVAGSDSLLTCGVCAETAPFGLCQPLLVSGEVIGSVLVQSDRPLDAGRVADRVVLAAPVLANLRNLAIAEQRALTDALTGLPNRRASNDTLRRMAAQASRMVEPLAAALVDLDHFKQINDAYGHDKGDDVLAAVGAALSSALRASDFAARYGGEEFLILLPATDVDGAVGVAEQVRRVIAAITIAGVDRPITASMGVAVLPTHARDAVTLVRQADRALYAAKAGGRNRTVVVDATNIDATDIFDSHGLSLPLPEEPAEPSSTTTSEDNVRN